MSKRPKLLDAQGRKTKKEEESDKDASRCLNRTPGPSATPPSSPSFASTSQDICLSETKAEANDQAKQQRKDSHAETDGQKDTEKKQQQVAVTSWIKKNIKKIQRDPSKDKEEVCHGSSKIDHLDEAINAMESNGEIGDKENHVHKAPTDAFGEINFGGFWEKHSKYARVSADTSPELLYELLTKQWKLDPPKLVISVTGGAKNFYLKSHLKKVFYRGIIKIAQITGAWIITGGTNVGVMKHVGLAVRDYALSNTIKRKIVAIGVAPWGVIHNKNKLVDKEGCFPANYVIDTEGQGDLTCLDNNHTHFLLVDDGTSGCYDVKIPLRAKLEKHISNEEITLEKKETDESDEPDEPVIKTPVVCVVLDGGLGTLKAVYRAICNNTPCVILEGSGRMADVIAQVFEQRKTSMKNIDGLIDAQMRKFFREDFEKLESTEKNECTKKIQQITEKRNLLRIFKASKDNQENMDVFILDSLLKALRTNESKGESGKKQQLRLAITWNRADLAQSEVFTEESVWKSSDLHHPMYLALVDNKPDFVSLLLENGVILKDFLKEDGTTLCELYKKLPDCFFLKKLVKRIEPGSCSTRQAISREDHKPQKNISLDYVSDEVRHLLGKFTKHIYRQPSKDTAQCAVCIWKTNDNKKPQETKEPPTIKDLKEAQRLAGRDLFLWAVVQNNKELAEIAWDQCGDCMSAALAASKILKKMAEEVNDADETQEMLELASHFEDRAIGVFNECYKNDEDRAQKLLVRVSRFWGKTTCLRLALEADNKNFVAQSGVQDLLTQIWCGELSVHNPVWRVLLCMVFFPLIYTRFLHFRSDEVIQSKTQKEKEKNKTRDKQSEKSRLVGLYCAPQVKFYGNIISYFAFLILFAYVLMVDFQRTPSAGELVLYIWLLSLICEEIRQLLRDPDNFGFCEKAKVYIKEWWNILDVLSILLFCLGLGFRLTTKMFYPGKITLCLDFVIFCLRLMAIFTISRTLGPKIIIVKNMMVDISFFMFLLSIWVVAYGVAKQGILIHNDQRLDWIIRGAIYEPYLIIFGSFPENIDNAGFDINSCSMNGTDPLKPKCPVLSENQVPAFPEWLTIIMLCVYLLFANILLLNLLIAIFDYTFQEVHDNTDKIWKFQRYQLIKEYYSHPAPPPPFIILSHLNIYFKALMQWKAPETKNKFKIELDLTEEEKLLSWQALMKDRYLLSVQKEQSQSMEGRIQDTSQKVTALTEWIEREEDSCSTALLRRLETLEEQVTQPNKALQWIVDRLKSQGVPSKETQPQSIIEVTTLTERLEKLEKQVTQSNNALQWIVDRLKSQGDFAKETQPQSTIE